MNDSKAISYYFPNYKQASSLKIFQDLTSQIRGYYFSKSNIKSLREDEFVNNYAVYFLFEDNGGNSSVYIGQSENGLSRIKNHVTNKEFWNYCIMFVTDNNQFDKTCIDYLEWYFINLFKGSKYTLTNTQERNKEPNIDNVFTKPTITNYASQIEFLLEANGIELISDVDEVQISKLKLYSASKGLDAHIYIYDGKFYLKNGSTIKKAANSSLEWNDDGAFHRRQIKKYSELVESGKAMDIDGTSARLIEDVMFNSPSAAAEICSGLSENGWMFWNGLNDERKKD